MIHVLKLAVLIVGFGGSAFGLYVLWKVSRFLLTGKDF
jgi:hypothetical protein